MIPSVFLDPDMGPRYTNTILHFAEVSGLTFTQSRHEIAWALSSSSIAARHRAMNVVTAALETRANDQPEMIGVTDFLVWAQTRVEVVDATRTKLIFSEVMQLPITCNSEAWRYLLPIFSAKIPASLEEFTLYTELIDALRSDECVARVARSFAMTTV